MLLSTAWLKVCIGPVGVCNNAELRALTETLQYISECVLNHWACDMISAQALQLICLWSNCAVQTVIYSLNSIISVSVMKIGSSSCISHICLCSISNKLLEFIQMDILLLNIKYFLSVSYSLFIQFAASNLVFFNLVKDKKVIMSKYSRWLQIYSV